MDRAIGIVLISMVLLAGCTEKIFVPVPVPVPPPIPPPPPQPSCVPVPSGALHWWPGDGTGADLIGGADATLRNGAGYTEGIVTSGTGEAFAFDGVDAIAQVAHTSTLSPSGPFSVMAWAKPGPVPTFNGAIIGKGDPWDEAFVLDHHNGVWRAVIRDVNRRDERIHGPDLVPNAWDHLAMTWDGTSLVFYVNGQIQGSGVIRTINRNNVFVGIGARSEAGFSDAELDLEFAGDIEEVVYFGRSLSGDEIREVYGAGALGMCKP